MLKGKRIVVTGASRGIGRAIAVACAREGAVTGINYNASEAEARTLHAENPKLFRLMKFDVREHEEVEAAVSEFCDKEGGIEACKEIGCALTNRERHFPPAASLHQRQIIRAGDSASLSDRKVRTDTSGFGPSRGQWGEGSAEELPAGLRCALRSPGCTSQEIGVGGEAFSGGAASRIAGKGLEDSDPQSTLVHGASQARGHDRLADLGSRSNNSDDSRGGRVGRTHDRKISTRMRLESRSG